MLLKGLGQFLPDWLEAALNTWQILTVERTVPSERKSRSRVPCGREAADLKGATAMALVKLDLFGKAEQEI